MREYAKKTENQSHTLDSNPKTSKQAPIDAILQRYKERNIQQYAKEEDKRLERDKYETAQRNGIGEVEFLQEKFGTAQHKELNGNEIMQSRFEIPSQVEQEPVLREEKPNNTGLPNNLKIGIENLSGYSMDDVRVHYNSDKPAQLNALAYTQGTDIHVASGQEQHLAHEAWHVVQQKQGRVLPTIQLQGVNVNDNEGLEKEADRMENYVQKVQQSNKTTLKSTPLNSVIQRRVGFEFEIGNIQTEQRRFSLCPPSINYQRMIKGAPLMRGNGFNVEADETEGGRSDLEFVTDAFPVTVAGFNELTQALDDITEIAGYIINRPRQRIHSIRFPHGNSIWNRFATYNGIGAIGTPQATIGISLQALDNLLNEISPNPGAPIGAAATPAQELFGGGLAPGFYGMSANGTTAQATGIPFVSQARNAAMQEIATLPLGVQNAELRALVTELVLYIVTGFDGVSGYGKTIAVPFMMRTDFGTVFNQLPLVTQNHFAIPNSFVQLVCNAARRLRPAIVNNGDLFEGGIYQNHMYDAGQPQAKTLAERQIMAGRLMRNTWLTNIVNGNDMLTRINFPAAVGNIGQNQLDEIESLGGYGNRMDVMGGVNLPILEIRSLPRISYGLFPLMAMDIFRYIFALNTLAGGGNPGQLQALGINDRTNMLNDNPAIGRGSRRNAIINARNAVVAWGVGNGG